MAIHIETISTGYVPGVCNIGPAEVKMRRNFGWAGLGVTVVAWGLFVLFSVPAPWRLVLFLPAAASASGFLQAALHFCAAFGGRGVFNFGPQVGKTEAVDQAEFRDKDKKKAGQIGLGALGIGVAVALLAFFLV